MTNIDICRKCYSVQTSCCTLKPDNNEKMMIPPVSEPEMARILSFMTSKGKKDLFVTRTNSKFYILQLLNLFPGMEKSIYKRFPENSSHFELKTKENVCTLLGPEGCRLPKEIRPHFCSIYPFWVIEDELLTFQDSNCLALKNSDTIAEAFLSLGTNPRALYDIYSRILADWSLSRTAEPRKALLP